MDVASGIHVFPQDVEVRGRELTLNPAAIETDRGLLLVDVGLMGTADQVEANLAEAGFGFDDVAMVLFTHQDPDHVGGFADVRDRVDPVVFAPREEVPAITGESDLVKHQGEERMYPPVDVDVEIVGGVGFRTNAGPVEVIDTPGHCPGHVSLYVPDEKLLIAADALTAMDGLSGPREEMTPDMDTAAESIERLADLDVDRTLCYHGGLVEAGSAEIADVAESLRG